MLGFPSDSPESFRIMTEASRISKEVTPGKAEIHARFALALAPCSCNCKFCSFAEVNGVFEKTTRIGVEEAVACAPVRGRWRQRDLHHDGLSVGTCLEPVGPEHSDSEIADRILFTAVQSGLQRGGLANIPVIDYHH